MSTNMNEVQNEDNMKKESTHVSSEGLAETASEGMANQMSAITSGDPQIQTDFSNYVPDYNYQANNQNLANFEESDGKVFNYGDYYNYYNNYYQQMNIKSDSTETTTQSNPRTLDLINKALAKQQLKSTEVRDDDEEEGQIPASPGIFNRSASRSPPIDSSRNSPYNGSNKSLRRSNSRDRSVRSHSRSRKRHTSRSRSRSPSRRRRRSRSRSPYFGPIIKDYRRGRRGFVRYPRGFRDRGMRPFRRGGHHSNYNYYGVSRRHEYSRSRSRSFSPKRRHIEVERIENNSDEEKTTDSKLETETQKPSDINETEKRLTQTFLAMLEEKQNRAKMIPMIHNNDSADNDSNRRHGFVNTFTTNIKKNDSSKHTLSYDLEREGWQVIDDIDQNADFKHNQNSKSTENDYYDDRRHHSESIASTGPEKTREKQIEMDSESSDYENKNKKKKSKKQKKKKKKRKASTSSDSESNSDNENADEVETKPKKRSKKKKKKSKKRKKKTSSSSSSSENEEQTKKHKKKKKKKDSSSESESEDKPEDIVTSVPNPVISGENDLPENTSSVNIEVSEVIKIKDKKKSKRKSSDSDSSDSDSDLDSKKKKKKKRKKSTKKRKHRSSSSSSSDSSDSTDSEDRKKKKKKKSKKSKSKKHKKKSEKKEKSKPIIEDKKPIKEENEDSEFVKVMSVGEQPLEMNWPKKLIQFTQSLPSLQYSINPKVTPNSSDFRDVQQITNNSQFEDIHRNETIDESHELTTEYERFLGELNPKQQKDAIDGEPHSLESKLRDKLVKQFYDRSDSQKPDLMTSSERRALEKSKKQSYNYSDPNDGHKKRDDLKCSSSSFTSYYSPKVTKSSPNHKTNESEVIETKIRGHESDHQNRVSMNLEVKEESSHRHESKSNGSKSEDKKVLAKELLERIKQRKPSDSKDSKESAKKESSDTKKSKTMPHIGKSKVLSKKSLLKKSVTTANADSTETAYVSEPMKLDMNYDYNWYYNYYMQSVYGIAQYPQVVDPALAAAYYAQYSMMTSYDYNQNDFNSWITQRGYSLDNNPDISQTQPEVKIAEQLNEQNIKIESLQPSLESTASDLNRDVSTEVSADQTNVSIDGTNKESNVGQTAEPNSDVNGISHQKNIEVLVSVTNPIMALEEPNDLKEEPLNGSPSIDSHNDSNIEGNSDSFVAPPPRPVMTTLTATEPITLPNGQVLPVGTKQVVVHPYKTEDPSKFTADWFCNALNGQNSTQNTTTTSQTNS